jgi:hypothetical protein
MTTISSRAFSANPIHYLNLAVRESVAVKRGRMIFRIMPEPQSENISPSGDPYWDDPRNVQDLKEYDKLRAEGKMKTVAVLKTSEDIKNYMSKFLS